MSSRQRKSYIKMILLGDSNVGKTSLLNRFMKDDFSQKYQATIGADFLSKEMVIGTKLVTLSLWDTAGQERYQSLGKAFYLGSDACAFVFDVTRRESFEHVQAWRDEFVLQANLKDDGSFPMLLLGNKCDLREKRQVTEHEAKQWCKAQSPPLAYFETSAKDDTNVAQAFQHVVALAVKNEDTSGYRMPEIPDLEPITTGPSTRKNCC